MSCIMSCAEVPVAARCIFSLAFSRLVCLSRLCLYVWEAWRLIQRVVECAVSLVSFPSLFKQCLNEASSAVSRQSVVVWTSLQIV